MVFDQPRPIRAWVARVDLASPEVELVVTCAGQVGDEFETACAHTLDFARDTGVQLAVNASPFSPFRAKAGEGMDVVGLAACDGTVFSETHASFSSLVVGKNGKAEIVTPPITRETLARIDDAAGGFHALVDDGKDISDAAVAKVAKGFAGVNPRTAVGLSKDAKTMWLVVVDGRQPKVSEGMTLKELAAFGLHVGCWDFLNLDGGGSTTMVLKNPESGEWSTVNTPVGQGSPHTLRLVANNLGVRIRTDAKHE